MKINAISIWYDETLPISEYYLHSLTIEATVSIRIPSVTTVDVDSGVEGRGEEVLSRGAAFINKKEKCKFIIIIDGYQKHKVFYHIQPTLDTSIMAEKGKANVKSCCSKENLNKNKKICRFSKSRK